MHIRTKINVCCTVCAISLALPIHQHIIHMLFPLFDNKMSVLAQNLLLMCGIPPTLSNCRKGGRDFLALQIKQVIKFTWKRNIYFLWEQYFKRRTHNCNYWMMLVKMFMEKPYYLGSERYTVYLKYTLERNRGQIIRRFTPHPDTIVSSWRHFRLIYFYEITNLLHYLHLFS